MRGLETSVRGAIRAAAAHKRFTPGKIIRTSSCDCLVSPLSKTLRDIPGICAIVKGSILPGYYGIEAGQSAVGDIYDWFVSVVCRGNSSMHDRLTAAATRLRPGQSGLLALDWNNGNRTILVDPKLSGLLIGQTLHTGRAGKPESLRFPVPAVHGTSRWFRRRETARVSGRRDERADCLAGTAEQIVLPKIC
ncbi:MAG: hypothetical protein GF418_09305 [Chitinivibrionales bacterium]|nr:hypothetical protein [Chitinivibrionales bacterium]MBD3395805.1 hypothetical protein [Chitinivibrionales bacterium]